MPKNGTNMNRRRTLATLGAGIAGLSGCLGGDGNGGNGDGNGGNGDGNGGNGDGNGGNGDGNGASTGSELTEFPLITPHFGAWNSTIPFVAGDEMGFFEEEGLEVSRVTAEGGGSNIRALVSSDAKACYSTGIAGLFASYREDANVRIVSNEFNNSVDMFFYTTPDSDYESIDDLEGATIAYSSPGSSTNMVAATAAEAHDGAEAVSIGGPPDANAALEGGEVDLAWATPPSFYEDINAGDYNIVFRGAEVSPFDNLSIRCNFVSENDLNENPDVMASYWSAHQRAIDWAYDNLDEAIELWAEARESDNLDILEQSIEDGFPKEAMQLDGFVGLDEANQLAVDFDFIDEPLSDDELNELINTDPLPMTDEDTFA